MPPLVFIARNHPLDALDQDAALEQWLLTLPPINTRSALSSGSIRRWFSWVVAPVAYLAPGPAVGYRLKEHLAGKAVRVRLFGSRARGDARTWSDIDIAVQASPALPPGVLSALREALEESSFLLNVNVVDWNDADAALRESIDREGIEWSV